MVVPVLFGFSPRTFASVEVGSPRLYVWRYRERLRSTATVRSSASALTTDAPTPWRPPETL